MKRKYINLSLLLIAAITVINISACSFCRMAQEEEDSGVSNHLFMLGEFMSGHFSNYEQAVADSNYYHIQLIMKPIWNHRKDGIWLYVEQSLASYPDKPYRQRVYQLVQYTDNLFESKVFDLKNAQRFIGAWQNHNTLSEITPVDLIPLTGCGVVLRKGFSSLPTFYGRTVGLSCLSTLHGASYIESEVEIRKDELISWDRGFNIDREQVWGPVDGGYIFKKTENFSLEDACDE